MQSSTSIARRPPAALPTPISAQARTGGPHGGRIGQGRQGLVGPYAVGLAHFLKRRQLLHGRVPSIPFERSPINLGATTIAVTVAGRPAVPALFRERCPRCAPAIPPVDFSRSSPRTPPCITSSKAYDGARTVLKRQSGELHLLSCTAPTTKGSLPWNSSSAVRPASKGCGNFDTAIDLGPRTADPSICDSTRPARRR